MNKQRKYWMVAKLVKGNLWYWRGDSRKTWTKDFEWGAIWLRRKWAKQKAAQQNGGVLLIEGYR